MWADTLCMFFCLFFAKGYERKCLLNPKYVTSIFNPYFMCYNKFELHFYVTYLNCCTLALRCHLRSIIGIIGPLHQECATLWRMLRINNPANDVTVEPLFVFVKAFIKRNCIH